MNRERFEKTRRIFLEARNLQGSSRERFLRGECGDESSALFKEVKTLLDNDAAMPSDFVEPPIEEASRKVASAPAPAASSAESMTFVPQVLGDYRLLAREGGGGRGVVYRAQHRTQGHLVALKMLSPGATGSNEMIERFRREGQSLKKLDHPNIARVLDVGSDQGVDFLAMELVEGDSLITQIQAIKDEPVPRDAVVEPPGSRLALQDDKSWFQVCAETVRDVARALHHAHERGIIHRDVKPGNILIDPSLKPRLIDFGIARDSDNTTMTRTGSLEGSPGYMSPEQACGLKVDDCRTDVYSLGAVLYEMLTRRRAFSGDLPSVVLRDVVEKEPVPVSRLNPEVPRDLAVICQKSMEKRIVDRYENAERFADDLDRFLKHRSILARPPSPADRATRWARKNRRLLLAAGFVVLLAVALLLVRDEWNRRATSAELCARVDNVLGDAERLTNEGRGIIVRADSARKVFGRLTAEAGLRVAGLEEALDQRAAELQSELEELVHRFTHPSPRTDLNSYQEPSETNLGRMVEIVGQLERVLGERSPALTEAIDKMTRATVKLEVRCERGCEGAGIWLQPIDGLNGKLGEATLIGRWPMEPFAVVVGRYRITVALDGYGFSEIVREIDMAGNEYPITVHLRKDDDVRADMKEIAGGPCVWVHENERINYELAPFLIDFAPVTNGKYRDYLQATGQPLPQVWGETQLAGWDELPVVQISVEEARAFAGFRGKRLPTAAEWLLAARGPGPVKYPWGDKPRAELLDRVNITRGSSLPRPAPEDWGGWCMQVLQPVRYFPATGPNDLFDLLGNVWQWTDSHHFLRDGSSYQVEPDQHVRLGLSAESHLENLDDGLNLSSSAPHESIDTGFRCSRSRLPPGRH